MLIHLLLPNKVKFYALDRILSSAIEYWRYNMHDFFLYSVKAIKSYWKQLLFLSLLCLGTSLVNLFIPLLTGEFFNKMVESPNLDVVIDFGIILFFINIFNIVLNYWISRLNISVQVESSYNLNKKILASLSKSDILELNNMDRSYLNQRINNDVNTVIIFIIGLIKDIIINLATLTISFLILSYIDIMIGWFFLMIFLFYVLLYKRIKQYIIHLQTSLLERKSQYFSKLQDCINYIKFIKLYSYNTFLSSSLNEKYSQMYTCMLKNQKYTYLLSTSEQIVLLFSQLFLYVVCGYRVIKGSLTIGIFMIMSSYFNYVVNSIKYFSSLYQQYLSAFAGYKRLIEIQQIKDDYQGDKKLGDINLIQIRNVSFAFKEGCIENNCIIRGLNIDFIKGNVYFICGKNGNGKSTFIHILLGLYTSYQGTVFFNSINARDIDHYELRKNHISFVDQNPILINSSIHENICLDNEASKEILKEYLIGFKLINSIESVDSFLSKNINELSTNVSGGESQKICIIRELIRNKKIMIFDEPSSNLDLESKIYFLKILNEIKKNHIIIIVTHDKIILDNLDGNIIQWNQGDCDDK